MEIQKYKGAELQFRPGEITAEIKAMFKTQPLRNCGSKEEREKLVGFLVETILKEAGTAPEALEQMFPGMVDFILTKFQYLTPSEIKQAWRAYCAGETQPFIPGERLTVRTFGAILNAYKGKRKEALKTVQIAKDRAKKALKLSPDKLKEKNQKARERWIVEIGLEFDRFCAMENFSFENIKYFHLNFLFRIGLFQALKDYNSLLPKAKAKAKILVAESQRIQKEKEIAGEVLPVPRVYSSTEIKTIQENQQRIAPPGERLNMELYGERSFEQFVFLELLETVFERAKSKGTSREKLESFLSTINKKRNEKEV